MTVLLISLSGCIVYDTTYPLLHSADKIETIEIYLLEAAKGEIPEEAIPVAYVDSADYSDFCSDLEDLPFRNGIMLLPVAFDPGWYLDGYVVKIIYDTGGFDIIAGSGYQYQQEADGSRFRGRHYSVEDDSMWNSFIEKYINISF